MEPAYRLSPTYEKLFSAGTGKVPKVAVNHLSFGIPVSSILTPPTMPRSGKCPECHTNLRKYQHKMSCYWEWRQKQKLVNRIVVIREPP